MAGIREGDFLVGIGDKDVKWDAYHQVVAKIVAAQNYLRITVVTPIKTCMVHRSSESVYCRTTPTPPPSSSIIPVFPPSRSRTSFSSLSSSTSGNSYTSDNQSGNNGRKKRSWAVLNIRERR